MRVYPSIQGLNYGCRQARVLHLVVAVDGCVSSQGGGITLFNIDSSRSVTISNSNLTSNLVGVSTALLSR
jgi:hypothetical protein